MATTFVPTSPTPTPRPSPGGEAVRFVAVRANLLPDEVRSARQTVALRKRVVIALGLVVVLLVGWYAYSWWQTSSARNDLSAAQRRGQGLEAQSLQYSKLVQAQGQVQSIQAQLRQLMTGDLPWQGMLASVRTKAPHGVLLTSVTATVNPGAATSPTSGAATLNLSGAATVGQLTITGTAPDKRTTAAYADALGTVKGLTAPLITNVTSGEHAVTFSVSLVITSAALGGRFTTTATGGH